MHRVLFAGRAVLLQLKLPLDFLLVLARVEVHATTDGALQLRQVLRVL